MIRFKEAAGGATPLQLEVSYRGIALFYLGVSYTHLQKVMGQFTADPVKEARRESKFRLLGGARRG
jgi:hypothetical protein